MNYLLTEINVSTVVSVRRRIVGRSEQILPSAWEACTYEQANNLQIQAIPSESTKA